MDKETSRSKPKKSGIAASGEGAQIQSLINGVIKAIRARDIEGILAAYSPEAVVYDIRDSLQYGKETLRKAWEECFAMSKTFSTEIHQLRIKIDGGVAFSHALTHAMGATSDGGKIDMWFRLTTCYSRSEGRWQVVHEHASVPGDFVSGKILAELKPEKNIGH